MIKYSGKICYEDLIQLDKDLKDNKGMNKKYNSKYFLSEFPDVDIPIEDRYERMCKEYESYNIPKFKDVGITLVKKQLGIVNNPNEYEI